MILALILNEEVLEEAQVAFITWNVDNLRAMITIQKYLNELK